MSEQAKRDQPNSDQPKRGFSTLIAEAKRRHVFRAAGLYAGGAFAVLQLADVLLPTLGLSEQHISWLLVAIAAGFPFVVVLTWVVDITPDGIQITTGLTPGEQSQLTPGRWVDLVILFIAVGVGYMYLERFTTEPGVTEETAVVVETPADESGPSPEPVQLEPSIAVLPFENLSDSKENDYFAKGIHEDILNHLSQNAALIVTSRTSTLGYVGDNRPPIRQIADELGVNYILEGSVRRAGNRVRVTIQLIQAATDEHLWAQNYDRELTDIFAIQDEVSAEVASKLRVQFDLISKGRPTESLVAYELYLEARSLTNTFDNTNLERAIELYDEALKIDPLYADAWAGMAITLASPQFSRINRQESDVRAKETAEQAIALDPDGWMSNFAMGSYYSLDSIVDFGNAIPHFQKAVEGNPNDALLRTYYGFALFNFGRPDLATEQFSESYRRNPLDAESNVARGIVAVNHRDYDAAKNYINRALEIDDRRSFVHFFAGNARSFMGDLLSASRHWARALEIDPQHLPATYSLAFAVFSNLGDYRTANYWLEKAEAIDPFSSQVNWRRAEILAAEGKIDEQIAFIEDWVRRSPSNNMAQRWSRYIPMRQARIAWDNEDMDSFTRLNQKALDLNDSYIRANSFGDGGKEVRFWSVWNFLRAGQHAKLLGDTALSAEYYNAVIDYANTRPEGYTPKFFFSAVAHAGLGNKQEALEQIRKLHDSGYRETNLLRSYYMTDDPYGIHDGIANDIAYMDVIKRMDAENAATLAAIREALPQLLPPDDYQPGVE